MQVGFIHLVGGFVALVLIVAGAFTVGSRWHADVESNTAAAAASQTIDATSSEAVEEEALHAGAPLYTVTRIVDGDTIVVHIDGKDESLRLIGIDTPEINDSRTGVQCFGKEASEYTKSILTGKKVRIEKDASQGERDKYKRLLAYVFREDGLFINRDLVEEGYAHEYTYDTPYKYQKQFKAAEVRAREEERGLWAPDACPTPAPKRAPKSSSSSAPKQTASAAAAVIPAQEPVQQQPASQPISQPQTQSQSQPQVQTQTPAPAPAPVPEPTPPSPAPQSSSDTSNYTCSANTYNCIDFKTQAQAQAVYDKCGGVSHDVHKLDKNKDGHPCDSLP